MAPRVTVALPYANAPISYLKASIESLLSQDVTDWDAFVLDDSPVGSADAALLVRHFSDPRLQYIRNTGPHGIGSAWNECLQHVRSSFACILHTDDELEPNYLSTMLRLADRRPDASIYFCRAYVIGANGRPVFSLADRVKDLIAPFEEPMVLHGQGAVVRLAIGDFIMCPTMFYRMSAISGRTFSLEHHFVLDWRFILSLLFDHKTIVGTRAKAYRYRRHSQQWTSGVSVSGERFLEERAVLRDLTTAARRRGWNAVLWATRLRPVFRLNVAYELLRDLIARRPVRKNKLQYLWI
jgi:glycosyltransferase involved in cell wall biosynthesis